MRVHEVLLLAVVLATTAAEAAVFDAGYSFTYHFDTMTYDSSIPGSTPLFPYLQLGTGSPFMTGTVSYDIYDGLPSETPVWSGTWTAGGPVSPGYIQTPVWGDLEGSFRITVVSGSQRIDSVFALARIAGMTSGNADLYHVTTVPTPVPEPGTLIFAGVAFLASLIYYRRKTSGP